MQACSGPPQHSFITFNHAERSAVTAAGGRYRTSSHGGARGSAAPSSETTRSIFMMTTSPCDTHSSSKGSWERHLHSQRHEVRKRTPYRPRGGASRGGGPTGRSEPTAPLRLVAAQERRSCPRRTDGNVEAPLVKLPDVTMIRSSVRHAGVTGLNLPVPSGAEPDWRFDGWT